MRTVSQERRREDETFEWGANTEDSWRNALGQKGTREV